jgi:hypothetical protein
MEHSQIHRSALVAPYESTWFYRRFHVGRERAEELGEEGYYHLKKGAAVF